MKGSPAGRAKGRQKGRTDMAIIINANREGYGTDQIRNTMTVGELIDALSDFDPETPIMVGNDRQSYGWYTYGSITMRDIEEADGEEDEDGNY